MSEPTDYAKLLEQMEHWKAYNCKTPSDYRARGEFWTNVTHYHFPSAVREVIELQAEVARLQILAAYLAGELSSGQAGRLLGIEDVVELREMAAAVIDAAGERWRLWREANPPERV